MGRKIFVAGANGGVGHHVVVLALQADYTVTALMRDPAKLPIVHPNLHVTRGDVMLPDTFIRELAGQDIVVSALGTGAGLFSDKATTVYSQGCTNLLAGMQQYGVKRFLCISADAAEINPLLPWYYRFAAKYFVQKLLRHSYSDIRLMEQIVKNSATDWTIIRPPQMDDGKMTRRYRIGINNFLKKAAKISRADVADFIMEHMADESTFRSTVEIAY